MNYRITRFSDGRIFGISLDKDTAYMIACGLSLHPACVDECFQIWHVDGENLRADYCANYVNGQGSGPVPLLKGDMQP